MRVTRKTQATATESTLRIACDLCPTEIGDGKATRVGKQTLCPKCYSTHRNSSKVSLHPFRMEAPQAVEPPRRALRKLKEEGTPLVAAGAALSSYLEAALWSSNDESTPEGGEPLDKNYSISDISPESKAAAEKSLNEFEAAAGDLLSGLSPERYGFLFWLNRNGHGSGFWDEEGIPEEVGNSLSDLSHKFGECYAYVGDDGVVYIDDPHASRAHPTASKKTASYELSFSPEFFMGPDDPDMTEPSHTPTTVWQAIVSAKALKPHWWPGMVEEVFPNWEYDPSELPETEVFDKIRETNTCGDLRSPVDVWIDPEGIYTLDVYDSENVERPNRATDSCSKCGVELYAGDQVLDDGESIYCSRRCAGPSPQRVPAPTDRALTTTNPDLAKVVEFRLEAGEDLRVGTICKSGGKEFTITNVTLTGWGISYEFDGGTDVVFVSF